LGVCASFVGLAYYYQGKKDILCLDSL